MLAIIFALLTARLLMIFTNPPLLQIQEVNLFTKLPIHFGQVGINILEYILSIVIAFVFAKFFAKSLKDKKKEKLLFTISFCILFITPWFDFLTSYFPTQSLILLIFVIALKINKKFVSGLLISLSIVLVILSANKQYLYLDNYKPNIIGSQINETQKILFLATNKTYMLPSIVRKAAYNKPMLIAERLLNQFISYFDVEQMVAPFDAYAILRMSGISPKGNFPLLYFWEIPIIIFASYHLIKKSEEKINTRFLWLFFASLIPFLFFEKKILLETAFLSIPFIGFLISYGVYKLFQTNKLIFDFLLILAVIELVGLNQIFYFKPLNYQTPHAYLYKQIADWINANSQSKNIVVTTRFGSTDKMVTYYLKNKATNIKFESFELINSLPDDNTYYIGLPGEFIKNGENFDIEVPSKVEIIKKINGQEETVYKYGSEIWIGYKK